MDPDKALKKALETMEGSSLTDGFEERLMKKILLETRKRKKRSVVFVFSLLTVVSLAMIAGTVYLFRNLLSVRIPIPAPDIQLSQEAGSMFGFYFYIAFLVLILLILDTYFRKMKHKSGME